MTNKDGMAKNLEVVTDGVKAFGQELVKIDGEVRDAWLARDWREYFHKVAAPPPEFFGHCRRLLGYIVMPVYYIPAVVYYTVKNLVRGKDK